MRKALVLALVLVMAFASSALAEVTFSGDFTATYTQKSFRFGTAEYTLDYVFNFNIKAANKDVTTVGEDEEAEDVVNWEFSAAVDKGNLGTLGKYKLVLNDEYFTANIWGNGQELSDKASAFGFITAGKAASEKVRARVEVPVLDLADVTVDFQAKDNIRAFVEAEVEGFDVGVAYARKNWRDTENVANVVVVQAGTEIEAGGVTIAPEAAVAIDIKKDAGMAFGVGADVTLTEELKVGASVEHANKEWANGDSDLKADTTVLSGSVTWEDAALKATASLSQTLAKDAEGESANTNTIDLDAWYRFSDKLTWTDLFKGDKWYTNNAPAAHAWADLTDVKLGEVGVEVAAPVMEDFIWLKGYAKYGLYTATPDATDEEPEPEEVKNKSYKLGVDGYIQATDKLAVTPFVYFQGLGKFLTVGTGATYNIGLSDTTLNLTLKRIQPFDDAFEKQVSSLVEASVKVTF